MSGQSAALTLKEACMMQERVQASGSHACNNGSSGGKKSGSAKKSMKHSEHMEKKEE